MVETRSWLGGGLWRVARDRTPLLEPRRPHPAVDEGGHGTEQPGAPVPGADAGVGEDGVALGCAPSRARPPRRWLKDSRAIHRS